MIRSATILVCFFAACGLSSSPPPTHPENQKETSKRFLKHNCTFSFLPLYIILLSPPLFLPTPPIPIPHIELFFGTYIFHILYFEPADKPTDAVHQLYPSRTRRSGSSTPVLNLHLQSHPFPPPRCKKPPLPPPPIPTPQPPSSVSLSHFPTHTHTSTRACATTEGVSRLWVPLPSGVTTACCRRSFAMAWHPLKPLSHAPFHHHPTTTPTTASIRSETPPQNKIIAECPDVFLASSSLIFPRYIL